MAKKLVDVYLIHKDMMGASEVLLVAYADKVVAELHCKDKTEEFVNYYTTFHHRCEEISGDRVIVDGKVYRLNRTTALEEYRQRGLRKLSKQERIALGLEGA